MTLRPHLQRAPARVAVGSWRSAPQRFGSRLLVLWLAGALPAIGCSTAATTCLQTPASNKLAAAAVASCEEALAKQPERRDLYLQTVELLRAHERYVDIVAWSKRALKQDPERPEALFYLAYGLRKSGRCEEALVQYQAFAAAKPEDPDPHFGRALCHQRLSQPAEAIAAYQTYVQKERRASQSAWVQRAREQIAALQGSGATAPAASGGARRQRSAAGVGSTAEPESKTHKDVVPTARSARSASTADADADGAAACAAAKQAISADPFDTAAYELFATCAEPLGQHEELVRLLRVALRDNPDYHRGWLHLGRALNALGRTAPAKSALAKACAEGISEACGL